MLLPHRPFFLQLLVGLQLGVLVGVLLEHRERLRHGAQLIRIKLPRNLHRPVAIAPVPAKPFDKYQPDDRVTDAIKLRERPIGACWASSHPFIAAGITNAEFQVADLSQDIEPQLAWAGLPYTHVLLDPPRAGALAALPTLARLQPLRLLYISCHPGSLARDIGILVHEHGFDLQAAGVLDMFPHTTHVESFALLLPGGRRGRR